MRIKSMITVGSLIMSSALFGADFKNGTHIVNDDDKAYVIIFDDIALSTKICECNVPTKEMKNGIVPVIYKNKIKGLTPISTHKKDSGVIEITARISSKTQIHCLSAFQIMVRVEGIGAARCPRGKSIVIRNGKLFLE